MVVRYPGPGRGYVAGEWFDAPEDRTLTYSPSLEAAIDAGDLTLLDPTPESGSQ